MSENMVKSQGKNLVAKFKQIQPPPEEQKVSRSFSIIWENENYCYQNRLCQIGA